ncbi:MAG: type I phosphomannose isomerase catalytic subunit [Verrucomicrobiota bacterium]
MAIDKPIVFQPLYQERVWGGRILETLFHRELPDSETPFGESWEVVDREGEQSVVAEGDADLQGKSLNELWMGHREEVFGSGLTSERFPVLVKILDARDRLSIQVHPPAEVASSLGGEPKTEMWYIARADEGARLYVGLKEGVDRDAFEEGIREGRTEDQVHAIEPRTGDFIFIPSGRLHAIGAGLVIYEIQQNSDTTYRVFDWNRVGLDGEPRELHVEASLQCIDFADCEPSMDEATGELLVDCPYFRIEKWAIEPGARRDAAASRQCAIVSVISGQVESAGRKFKEGDFFLIPASATDAVRSLQANGQKAEILRTTLGSAAATVPLVHRIEFIRNA